MRRILTAAAFLFALALPARADSGVASVPLSAVLTATSAVIVGPIYTGTQPMKYYSLQVKGSTGTVQDWSATLQGSLDGLNFTTILTHAKADLDGTTKVQATTWPAQWLRLNISSITYGSSATKFNIYAVGVQ